MKTNYLNKNNSEEKEPVVEINVNLWDSITYCEKFQIISTVDELMNITKTCSEISNTNEYFASSNYYEFLSAMCKFHPYEWEICRPLLNYLCCKKEFAKIVEENQNGGYIIMVKLNKEIFNDVEVELMEPELLNFLCYNLHQCEVPYDSNFDVHYKMTFGSKLELISEDERNLMISIAKIISENSETNEISLSLLKEKLNAEGYEINWDNKLILHFNLEFYNIDKVTETFELYDWFWVEKYLKRNYYGLCAKDNDLRRLIAQVSWYEVLN